MEQVNTFSYNYSAKDNQAVQEIRKKYLPQNENKMDELIRLDRKVQKAGITQALCVGIVSTLIFGCGMCLAMQILGSGVMYIVIGVVVGLIGMIGMGMTYPVYRKKYNKTKAEYAPRILELTEELAGANNSN